MQRRAKLAMLQRGPRSKPRSINSINPPSHGKTCSVSSRLVNSVLCLSSACSETRKHGPLEGAMLDSTVPEVEELPVGPGQILFDEK